MLCLKSLHKSTVDWNSIPTNLMTPHHYSSSIFSLQKFLDSPGNSPSYFSVWGTLQSNWSWGCLQFSAMRKQRNCNPNYCCSYYEESPTDCSCSHSFVFAQAEMLFSFISQDSSWFVEIRFFIANGYLGAIQRRGRRTAACGGNFYHSWTGKDSNF